MTDIAKHHRIDYIELPMLDPERTKDFYAMVFGWSFQDWGPDYISFNDGQLDGGFRRGAPLSTAGALVILYSRDLEATRSAVLAAGGTLHLDIFSFPGGRRFHFLDPEGNHLAVWSE